MKNIFKNNKALVLSILALSLPAIVEMSLNTLLGVADNIMLGQLINSSAIASVGYSNQIIFLLIFTFSAFNTGAIALISRAYGERDFDRLKKVAEQNVVLNLIIGTIILAIAWTIKGKLFLIYDIEAHVYDDALAYFTIILLGFIPMFLSFSFAAILRGSGNTKTPMVITGIVNLINVVFNYCLITGFAFFPELGIVGAAISTSFARLVATGIYIYILYISPKGLQLRPHFKISRSILKPLFRISWPGAIEQGLMQLSFVVVGMVISKLETSSESLFRILIQIESLSFMPAVGISIATATLVGKALGEKNIDKAKTTGFASASLGICWGIIMGIIFLLVPDLFIKAFTKESAILALGLPVLPFMALNQPGLNYMIVMGGALRGAGDTKVLMYLTIIRLWAVFVPLTCLFILALQAGVSGVWYAEIISIGLFSFLLYKRFQGGKWAEISVK